MAGEDDIRGGVVAGPLVKVVGETHVLVPGAAGACEPRVDVIRDGNVIQAIDIVCTCGKQIRLKCVY